MNPAQYRPDVLRQLEARWNKQCFCHYPQYQKLVAFNFEDHYVGPVFLADAEILIHHFIREKFQSLAVTETPGELITKWRCPQCASLCQAFYSEYSINMSRTYVTFEQVNAAQQVGYLIGFYGFDVSPSTSFKGYEKSASIEAYLAQFDAGDWGIRD